MLSSERCKSTLWLMILFSALLLLIVGCVSKEASDNNNDPFEYQLQRLTDKEWGISFMYPVGWQRGGLLIRNEEHSYSFRAEDITTIAVGVEILKEPISFEEYSENQHLELKESTSTNIQREEALLGGENAVKFEYENNIGQRVINVQAIVGNNLYWTTCHSNLDSFDKYLPLFTEVIQSIEFIDSNSTN